MRKSFNLRRNLAAKALALLAAVGLTSHCTGVQQPVMMAETPAPAVDPEASQPAPAPEPAGVLEIIKGPPLTLASGEVRHHDLLEQLRADMVLPRVDNKAVARELAWYAGHPEYLNRVFIRARRYMPHIVASLQARRMPLDLALLPIVESAYDPFAYSHGRAAGLWQIIPGTGHRLGVAQNWWFDGRRDVLESTRGALDYLQRLHDQFDGDWLLAVAAYNSGEGHVARAIKANRQRQQPIDFWNLAKRLPKETRTYVPRLLALRALVAEPAAVGLDLPVIANERQFAVVDTGGQIDMALAAQLADQPTDVLYAFNPGVNRWATAPNGPHRLLVPYDQAEDFALALAELGPLERVKWSRHKVKPGETLGHIAMRYHTTPAVLRQVNDLGGNLIRAGSYLMIPHAVKSMSSYRLSADARLRRQQDKPRKGTRSEHRVQPGESFWSIAQRYQVGVRELAAWNSMAPGDTLSIGRKLVVWHQGLSPPQDTTRIRRLEYVVRRGDSLAVISSRFRVSIDQVLKWNKISVDKYLQPGQRLVLYVDVTKQSS